MQGTSRASWGGGWRAWRTPADGGLARCQPDDDPVSGGDEEVAASGGCWCSGWWRRVWGRNRRRSLLGCRFCLWNEGREFRGKIARPGVVDVHPRVAHELQENLVHQILNAIMTEDAGLKLLMTTSAAAMRPWAKGFRVSLQASESSLVTPKTPRATQSRKISFTLRFLNIPVIPLSRLRNCGENPACRVAQPRLKRREVGRIDLRLRRHPSPPRRRGGVLRRRYC